MVDMQKIIMIHNDIWELQTFNNGPVLLPTLVYIIRQECWQQLLY